MTFFDKNIIFFTKNDFKYLIPTLQYAKIATIDVLEMSGRQNLFHWLLRFPFYLQF